jgi:hypothetical protein
MNGDLGPSLDYSASVEHESGSREAAFPAYRDVARRSQAAWAPDNKERHSMAYDWRTEVPGVFARHADDCPRRDGGLCICGPLAYRASVVDPDTGRRSLSPEFETVAEAQAWQRDQHESVKASNGVPVSDAELGAVIDEFLQDAEDGRARDRNGNPYSPERLRQLRGSLSYVDSALGSTNLEDVRRRHVQAMVDQLRGAGVTTDRVTSITAALRSLYAYAIQRDLVGYSPVVELSLPGPDELEPSDNGAGHELPTDTLSGVVAQAPRVEAEPEPKAFTPAAMPMEQVMWWAVKVVVLLFALIALVLVAESV